MKVKTKLVTGFSSIIVLLLITGIWAYFSLSKLSDTTNIFEGNMLQLDLASRLRLAIEEMLVPPHDYFIHRRPAEKEHFDRLYAQVEQMFASLEKTNLPEGGKNTLKEFKALCSEVRGKALEVLNLEPSVIGSTSSVELMEQMDVLTKNLVSKIDVLNQKTYETTAKTIFHSKIFTYKTNRFLFYCALIILVNAFAVGFLIFRSIAGPIKSLREGAELISVGKLDHRVNIRSQDELKDLADAFNKMVGSLEKSLVDIEEEKNKLETILLNIGDGVVVGDAKYHLLFMNPVAEKILGTHYKDLQGKEFFGCHRDGDKVMKMLENDQLPVSTTINYGPYIFHINATSIKGVDEAIIGYTMIIRDVTEQERMREKLEELATTDGLTGAYNHKYFQERLDYEFERSKRYSSPLSLLMVDIDYFKNFNDQFGHQLGDEVLVTLTNILKDNLRHIDTIARYGGEEFAVILPNTEGKEGFLLAERLRMKIESYEIKGEGSPLRITISIGLSTFDGTNFNNKVEFIKATDDALYRAKRNGRNRVEIITVPPISA